MGPTGERGPSRPAVATETQLFLVQPQQNQEDVASQSFRTQNMLQALHCVLLDPHSPALSLGPRAIAVLLADGTVAQSCCKPCCPNLAANL